MDSARKERAKDLGSVAVVLSVAVIVAILFLCPIVGALVEGTLRWEQSFPLK